jgi:hypothetical protein
MHTGKAKGTRRADVAAAAPPEVVAETLGKLATLLR